MLLDVVKAIRRQPRLRYSLNFLGWNNRYGVELGSTTETCHGRRGIHPHRSDVFHHAAVIRCGVRGRSLPSGEQYSDHRRTEGIVSASRPVRRDRADRRRVGTRDQLPCALGDDRLPSFPRGDSDLGCELCLFAAPGGHVDRQHVHSFLEMLPLIGLTAPNACGADHGAEQRAGTGVGGLARDTAVPFYWDMNDATRAFSLCFQQRHPKGNMPNDMQSGVYASALHYLTAVDKVGSASDGKAVVADEEFSP